LTLQAQSPSGRDPDGRLYIHAGRILRVVYASGVEHVEALLQSRAVREFVGGGKFVVSQRVAREAGLGILPQDDVDKAALVLEHERIAFPSYPYEWPPEMLFAAGCLTLELAEALIAEDLGLKDATPFNVLFRGPQPVFIDVLSVERRDAHDPVWLPKAQFDRTFILPLLASRYFGVSPTQTFLSSRDGLAPEQLYALCGTLRSLTPRFLGNVTLPVWLGKTVRPAHTGIYRKRVLPDAERARFVLRFLLGRLRSQLGKLSPLRRNAKSAWSAYEHDNSYSSDLDRMKASFVEDAARECAAKRVLDVGCNTGRFSVIAAGCGASVVAIDSDPVVIGRLWESAREQQLDILPLVVDFARPTPATGWRNAECKSFMERASGAFDLVMMLAVVHHLLVTERIPLSEIVDVAAALTTSALIVEFVGVGDPMFQALLRGRDKLFADFSPASFEAAFARRFEIVRSAQVGTLNRRLYLMRKKPSRDEA
jgi:SAM-dependent methyltransferase